jgi:UbiD family decarboxylase
MSQQEKPQEGAYDGLRSFLAECEKRGEVTVIRNADWNLEIGALTEATCELIDEPPALLFDEIAGYPAGFRVLSIPAGSRARMALALRLPPDTPKMEIVRHAAQRLKNASPIPPKEVAAGPVMANVMRDNEVDLLKFPVLKSHREDGGRYICTGCTFLNRDPESGYVNMGTYRMQVHEGNLLGIWQSPGQQGRLIAERYWREGKACPVVATFGGDPLLFFLSHTKFPFGISELDRAGGMLGHAVEVIKGPLTGLPIPAHAEIAIEGEMPPPDVETRLEGPFGEWPGYYASSGPEPVLQVKAIYHRNDPIQVAQPPARPIYPGTYFGTAGSALLRAASLWDDLEAAGVPGIKGVWKMPGGGSRFINVIAIEQMHAGHAKMAGLVAAGCGSSTYLGRIIIIVDDDIDITNPAQVMWAVATRWDPKTATDIIDGMWTGYIDPMLLPERRASGDLTNSRIIIYAVRPWAWKDQFPKVNAVDPAYAAEVARKWAGKVRFLDDL